MDTARYKAFITAAETGTISKAADAMCYTPSGVSQLIGALEQELGLTLLERTRKGVSLTSSGRALLPVMRDLLRQEERLYEISSSLKGLDTGSICIASLTSIAAHWLPEVIARFQEDYPNVELSLVEGIRQDVCDLLDEGRADIGFMSYIDNMNYDWIPLAEDRMLAVLPANHPLAGAKSFPLERCSSEPFIMPAMGRDEDVDALFQRFGITPDIRFSTQQNFAAMSMVEKGLGISVMNELITEGWQCNVAKLPLDPPQQMTMGIAVRGLEHAAPAAKCFIDYAVRLLTREEEGATVAGGIRATGNA